MATSDLYTVMGGLQPYRHGIRLLGGDVDDGIRVQALAAAIVAGNHTKGTITAWVMVPDDSGTYGILGFGDTNAVEYVIFNIAAGKLQFKVSDGGGTRVDFITTNKVIVPHRWTHVAIVQAGDNTGPIFYVDGVAVAITETTATEKSQWFDDTDAIDDGYLGANFSIAGGGLLTNEFAGYISDFKIWSGTTAAKALTADQIKEDYNGNSPTGYIAWYKFAGDAVDYGTGGGTYDGTVTGAIIYVDACEFTSRLTFGCGIPLTADNISIAMNGTIGLGFVVQQA